MTVSNATTWFDTLADQRLALGLSTRVKSVERRFHQMIRLCIGIRPLRRWSLTRGWNLVQRKHQTPTGSLIRPEKCRTANRVSSMHA